MPDIRTWQDYPEFLARVEKEFGVTSEDLEQLTLDELASALYDFNPKIASIKSAQWLKKEIRAQAEIGVAGSFVDWNETIERFIWRDVETGRFVKAPSGFSD